VATGVRPTVLRFHWPGMEHMLFQRNMAVT